MPFVVLSLDYISSTLGDQGAVIPRPQGGPEVPASSNEIEEQSVGALFPQPNWLPLGLRGGINSCNETEWIRFFCSHPSVKSLYCDKQMLKHVHVQKILMRGLNKDDMYCTVCSLFCIKLTTKTNFNYCQFVWISLFSTISGCPLDQGNAVSVFVSVSWIS